MKKPVSITLAEENLLWLRGQAAATPRGSVSEVLDRIVSDARSSGRPGSVAMRSVRNTIDLPDDDANLAQADSYIRGLFDASLRRPILGKEPAATYGRLRKKAKRRG